MNSTVLKASMLPKPIRIKNKDLLEQKRLDRCIICDAIAVDAHHVISRGAFGGDLPNNLMSLCRLHHQQIHQYGISKMVMRSGKLKLWLQENGWHFDEVVKKWHQR